MAKTKFYYYLKELGISQSDLAVKMNTTKQNISHMVNNPGKLTSDRINKIASALGISPDILFYKINEKFDSDL